MKKKIFVKIFISLMMVALIPIILIGGVSIAILKKQAYSEQINAIDKMLLQSQTYIEAKLDKMNWLCNYVSTNKLVIEILQEPISLENIAEIDKLFEYGMFAYSELDTHITIAGVEGQVYINWTSDGSLMNENYYERLMQETWYLPLERKKWVGNMKSLEHFGSKEEVISVINPIYGKKDRLLGLAIISIPERNIIESIGQLIINEESMSLMIDHKGEVIGGVNNYLGMKHIDPELLESMQSDKGSLSYELEGDKYQIIYRKNKLNQWMSVVILPHKSLYQMVSLMKEIVIGGIVLCILIVMGVAYVISKSISLPIRQLEKTMMEVKEGQFNKRAHIKCKDEIGRLSEVFNIMIEEVSNLHKKSIEDEQHKKQLIVSNMKSELQFLRAQISPHFLFNTLNSIKCLALIYKVPQIEEMISHLGSILEASMQKGTDRITLEEEINIVEHYVQIQCIRYPDTLSMDFDLGAETLGSRIPKFILQPLVENAIIHGIAPVGKGHIVITSRKTDSNIEISIKDNGKGISTEALEAFRREEEIKKGKGFNSIGIINIDRRLKLLFGEDYGLTINQLERGTEVTLAIPITY